MTQELRKTKIKVLSEEHSKAIQEAVFDAGGKWQDSGRFYQRDVNFIFLSDSLGMSLCDNAVFFQEHDYKEIQFPLPTKDIYTKHKEETQMKQLIIHVDGLTIEEKQRVAKALAKIKNIGMCNPTHWDKADTLYAPSSDGINVGFNCYKDPNPTHSPQQVLEMAGMTTKRKVRKDFDPAKEYSVDVSKCTEEEKKEVQQAFFDVGILWKCNGAKYGHPSALQYTNKYEYGCVSAHYLYVGTAEGCNMTAKEFLDLVYEPEQQGHVHAQLMAQYAEDAKTTNLPWELWQVKGDDDIWWNCQYHPTWGCATEYRHKPKTHIVHGVEVTVFEFTPKVGEKYYVANVGLPELFEQGYRSSECCTFTQRMIERGLIYPYTEEGKQAAILHSKAMLCIA